MTSLFFTDIFWLQHVFHWALWIIPMTKVCQGLVVVVERFFYHNEGTFFGFLYVRYGVMGRGMMRWIRWNAVSWEANKCTKEINLNGHQVTQTIKWEMLVMESFESIYIFFYGYVNVLNFTLFISLPFNLFTSYHSLYEKACPCYWTFLGVFILDIDFILDFFA